MSVRSVSRPAALAVLLALAWPAHAQADASTLQIDARRLGVMVDQSQAALHALAPRGWPDAADGDGDDGDAFAALAAAVARYDAMVARACRANLAAPRFCGAPYDPPWLASRPPGDAALRAEIDEAGDRISSFWSEVCARASQATGDADFCGVE